MDHPEKYIGWESILFWSKKSPGLQRGPPKNLAYGTPGTPYILGIVHNLVIKLPKINSCNYIT